MIAATASSGSAAHSSSTKRSSFEIAVDRSSTWASSAPAGRIGGVDGEAQPGVRPGPADRAR